MAIQIGKYKRPGIFLEEFDNSVITTPIVEGLTNLVIGVSKKGPVNTPVRLTTVNDLEAIFGQLDRGLERKGSFFHRTVSKMLESSPVYAINLLLTDDNLDKIEYKSLSSSADYLNDIEREGAYRRFHDTTGFWKRDVESFINITKNNTGYSERTFSLTNLSDRYATVFIFKSTVSGFNRTLIEWYGSAEKMPPYVNVNDWASDYMVDVLIVGGDWSNYKELSVDPRWSAYFSSEGLRKEKVSAFAFDANVTTLSFYEGLSLIPYFRDFNGKNLFIETNINRDTDKTGIFCAFNHDLVETDFFNGRLDLVGHTIAGKNETDIEFLSYKETIMEKVEFKGVPLDLPGNVTALLGTFSEGGLTYLGKPKKAHAFGTATKTGFVENGNRTTWFSEGYVNDLWCSATASNTTSDITMRYDIDNNAYAVIGDSYVTIASGATLSISANNYTSSGTYSAVAVLDSTGLIKIVTTAQKDVKPTVATTDIVLSYLTFNVNSSSEFTSVTQENVSIGFGTMGAFKNLQVGSQSATDDYYVTPLGDGSFKVTFVDTAATPSVKEYKQYRRFKMFNLLVDLIDSPNKDKMIMLLDVDSMKKVSLSNVTISDIVTSSLYDKSFVLNTGLSDSELSSVFAGLLVFYTVDNEFILGTELVNTSNLVAAGATGSMGKYSTFYSKFYNGDINTGDFFYSNKIPSAMLINGASYSVEFIQGEMSSSVSGYNTGATQAFAGKDYIVLTGSEDPMFENLDEISIYGSTLNSGKLTIISQLTTTEFGASTGQYVYQVNENTTYEVISGITQIFDLTKKHYLKMSLDSNENLTVEFLDELLETSEQLVSIESANTFYVNSANSNYKQSIEIEVPNGYTEIANKILVKAERYTEVKVGDFLEADYDESTLKIGEYPRKLTRIVGKKQYANDVTLVEISCDAKIKKSFYGGVAYQTTRYKSVDSYALTYKGISLKGFRVRQDSLPDGTETKQNQILNLVAKGTPIFKALTNKESIDFRYLIDSFGLGLTERSKQQLVDICGDRLDVFGFLNMPSLKSFKNSSSPSFVNSDGVLQLEYVAKGADPESGPAFLYSFGDGPGTTCVGYFLPYLTVNDNGKPLDMPPASYVATTYMRKHNSNQSGITPWTIAAGVTNGRITNIAGIEMYFSNSDIEWLNGAQMNPIVFKRNRGNVIETENTAQTLYKSALSYIHVREVLIELERELSRMLLDFQWKYNTPDVRAEIKLRADVICEGYVSKNGLYNYFNKCDDENNTADIIDNQIGVLDTYVEPGKGMGIIVNNVTILRTGAISAGGFQ